MSEIIQLDHLKEGFEPSESCLKLIAATRKESFPIKLGNINYYRWYNTSEIGRDRFMFITAFIAEFLILICLFYFAFRNGSISERETIILICTVLFIPIDIFAFRIIARDFFQVNKYKQQIEILSGTGDDQIKRFQASAFIKDHNNKYWLKSFWLYVSLGLKLTGILLTSGLPTLPKIFLSIVAFIILYIHYNFSPYFFTYLIAAGKYNKEYKNSNHKTKVREPKEVVINEPIKNDSNDLVNAEPLKPNFGYDFLIFDLHFDASNAKIIIFNNKLLLDDTLITAVNPQKNDYNKDLVAKMLIKHQINI
jgi:hypothetical protein